MQNKPASIEDLFHQTGEYLETRVELVKLKAIDKSSEVLSSVIAGIFVVVILTLFLFALTIGAALWIGEMLGRSFYGFFIIAGFYAILALLIYGLRTKLIKTPITKMFVDKILK